MPITNGVDLQKDEKEIIPEAPQSFTGTHSVEDTREKTEKGFLSSTGTSSQALQRTSQVIPILQTNISLSSALASCSAFSAREALPEILLSEPTTTCDYHRLVLSLAADHPKEQLLPLDRFLADGPGRQYAMFVVGDCGRVSTSKRCTCRGVGEELEVLDKEDELADDETGTEEGKAAQKT